MWCGGSCVLAVNNAQLATENEAYRDFKGKLDHAFPPVRGPLWGQFARSRTSKW